MSDRPGPSHMHPDDPHFEEWCTKLLEAEDEWNSDIESDQEDTVITSEHDTDTATDEAESDSSQDDEESDSSGDTDSVGKFYYGKPPQKFKWSKEYPPTNVRTRAHNKITVKLPGLRSSAKLLGDYPSPKKVWKLLFTDDILQEIIRWTNLKISEARKSYKTYHFSLKDTDMIEMNAFLGLLIYTEVFKSGNENIDCLFATDGTGRDVFRCTMTKRRFEFLLCCLRFDNPLDREDRKKNDPSAAISHLFESFVRNCQNNYYPGIYVCVDEMLVAFRGRSKFKIYMPKKPNKYGIKIMCLTDARSNFLFNAYIYSGKGSDGRNLSDEEKRFAVPTQALIKLVKPLENSNRNVTADNWFSSVEAVTELKRRGLTYLGTLKKNKREIPAAFLPHKNKEINSSMYGFTKEMTLLSFVPKKSKSVLLISSMHHAAKNDQQSGKPEMIEDYNLTKGGVDSLDRKCANYSPSRRTRRWPMAVFFAMLNISTVNAYIMHQSYKKMKKMERKDFLLELAKYLVSPYMGQRLEIGSLSFELRVRIESLLGIAEKNVAQPVHTDRLDKKKTCSRCPYKLKRKTFYVCAKCSNPICLEHARKICQTCMDKYD